MLNYSWSEDYSVGNDTLNEHHKHLIQLFNDAYKLVVNDSDRIKTIKLISELSVYTVFHFREEEKLMKEANYPDFDEHVKEHQQFINEVKTFKNNLELDTETINEELFIFLSNWLMNHIQKTDMKYKGLL